MDFSKRTQVQASSGSLLARAPADALQEISQRKRQKRIYPTLIEYLRPRRIRFARNTDASLEREYL